MATFLDVMTDLSLKKTNLINNNVISESSYLPYMINKGFSYHVDSLYYANDMNMLSCLDKKLQHDYYFYSLPKKNRVSKWFKSDNELELEKIMKYFGCSKSVAIEYKTILGGENVKKILDKFETGGKTT